MALVKDDAAIEALASNPVNDLLETCAATTASTDKRAVGEEQHALLEVLGEAADFGGGVEGGTVVYDRDLHPQVP